MIRLSWLMVLFFGWCCDVTLGQDYQEFSHLVYVRYVQTSAGYLTKQLVTHRLRTSRSLDESDATTVVPTGNINRSLGLRNGECSTAGGEGFVGNTTFEQAVLKSQRLQIQPQLI